MFNKKKKKIDPHENQINFFLSQIKDAEIYLQAAVEAVLYKKNVIDVYPSGADKNRAQEELEDARVSLLLKIARYDDCRARYFEYLEKNKLPCYAYPYPTDSHILVEIFVYNYNNGKDA